MKRFPAVVVALALVAAVGIVGRVTADPPTGAAFALSPSLRAQVRAAQCGKWRWLVKTLADDPTKDGQVKFSPRWTSVRKVTQLAPPDAPWEVAPDFPPPPAFGRFGKLERQAVLLPVRLTRAKKELDGDIHLIVSSPSDSSLELVVEFPNLSCTDPSPKKQQIENARQKLLDACGPIDFDWKKLHHAKAYISGVPFFDFGHGKGHPQNGAEIHPALGFSAATC